MSNNKRKERSEQKELSDTRAFYGRGKYILAGVAAVVAAVVAAAQLVGGFLFVGILAAIGFVVWGFWLRYFLADWRKEKNKQKELAETRVLHDEVAQDNGLDEEVDALKKVKNARDVADAAFEISDLFDMED